LHTNALKFTSVDTKVTPICRFERAASHGKMYGWKRHKGGDRNRGNIAGTRQMTPHYHGGREILTYTFVTLETWLSSYHVTITATSGPSQNLTASRIHCNTYSYFTDFVYKNGQNLKISQNSPPDS